VTSTIDRKNAPYASRFRLATDQLKVVEPWRAKISGRLGVRFMEKRRFTAPSAAENTHTVIHRVIITGVG
jgi:exonuclease V gamma subunit